MAANKTQIMDIVIDNARWRLAYYDLGMDDYFIVDLDKFENGDWAMKATSDVSYNGTTPRETRWSQFMAFMNQRFEAVLNAGTLPQTEKDIIIGMLKTLKIALVNGKYTITSA